MKRYKSIFKEQFAGIVQSYNGNYDVFSNPSSSEMHKIPSFKKRKELRGVCSTDKNLNYVFDSEILHNDIRQYFKLIKDKYINYFIDTANKEIHFHCDDYDYSMNKYLNTYFGGYKVFFMGNCVGEI